MRVQFALILAIAMAPAGLVAVIQASANIEDAIRLEEEQLRNVARRVTEDERTAILAIRERLRVAARSTAIRALSGDECDEATRRLVENDPRFAGALVLNDAGMSVCGDQKGIDVSGTVAFQSFVHAQELLVGPVRSGALDGRNMLLALAPVVSEQGRTGILAVGLAADFFQAMAARSKSTGGESRNKVRFALLDQAGTVFAENWTGTKDWMPVDIDPLLREDEVLQHLQTRGGDNGVFYVAPMPIQRMWLIASRPELTWQDILWSSNSLAFVTPLLLWAIAVGVAFFVIDRMVSRPIVYLQRLAAAIGRGHLDIGPINFEGAPYEIQRLGAAIEHMAENLAEREATLRGNVESKKALLLEIHHRVKNNLQMISSLMNMQLRRVEGAAERRAIQILQDRIHGLALVHQNLYSAERLDAVALDELVRDIAEHLRQSLCPSEGQCETSFDLEPIEASADVATPVALFLTEAVSNVFKHSWRRDVPLVFGVRLLRTGEDTFELSVTNSRHAGEGEEAPPPEDQGLGGQLMQGFARQIGGEITREVGKSSFSVTLKAPFSARSRGFAIRARDRKELGEAKSAATLGETG